MSAKRLAGHLALLAFCVGQAGCGAPFAPAADSGSGARVKTVYILPSEPLAFASNPAPGASAPAPVPVVIPESPAADLADLTQRFKLKCGEEIPTVAARGAQSEGASSEFSIFDLARHRIIKKQSTLRLATDSSLWYVQNGVVIDPAALRMSAKRFDEQIVPTTRRFFGQEPEVGPDGESRITIWIGEGFGVGGYFSLADLYARTVNQNSNERKLLVINSQGPPVGSDSFLGELAHEFQHMVQSSANPLMGGWLNEGSSELAMKLNGFEPFPPTRFFSDQPDVNLTGWDADASLAGSHYAAAYLFLSYFGRRLGSYETVRELLHTSGTGAWSVDNYLTRSYRRERFDDLFMDWIVANYLHDGDLEAGRFNYEDAPQLQASDVIEQAASRPATVQQFGAHYIDIRTPGDLEIDFAGAPRVRLFDAEPHSGQSVWWSNRGDSIDSTLTRNVNLSQAAKATLHFWTWYDLEQDFDFGYVAVSEDKGCTWKTVPTNASVTLSVAGNNLGDGLTGFSGGGDDPRWIEQVADLTPWAGKEILLRFESVTDGVYNGAGLVLDDLSIPEINWSDDAESLTQDWQARGFIRTPVTAPQTFGLRLIKFKREGDQERPVSVDTVGLSDQMTARFDLNGLGSTLSHATLVISGLNRNASEAAQFRFSVRPKPPAS